MDKTISRRQFGRIGAAAATLAALSAAPRLIAAAPIESTKRGEVPTTGGLRPGPMGISPRPMVLSGAKPVSLQIGKIGLDAQVETIEIVNGVMQNPTGPWIVSWYKETAKPGQVGNIVIAGHLDYWDVGPAVFYNITQVAKGDTVAITGDDGQVYTYAIEWLKNYDVANAPIQEIVGPTKDESLTLITCGGPFDYNTGHYLQRTVVRSHRVSA